MTVEAILPGTDNAPGPPPAAPPARPSATPSTTPSPTIGKRGRFGRIVKFVAYPLFYFFCLAVFGYLSFPYDLLKARLIAEFDRSQRAKRRNPGEEVMHLEIDKLDSYWITGVEITGARIVVPPKPKKAQKKGLAGVGAEAASPAQPPAPSVIKVDSATARVRILPLLLGDVIVDFAASAFGGEIEGTLPYGGADEPIALSFENVSLMDIQPLQAVLDGVPLQGVASGKMELTPKGGKLAVADGSLSLQLAGVKLGKQAKDEEGKPVDVLEVQKVQVPSVLIGTINIEATAKDGLFKLADLSAKSADFELLGEGTIKLAESWDRSRMDVFLKFKFTDAYRDRVPEKSSALLGKPGDSYPPAIENLAPQFKQAKTDDEFYRFQVVGPLSNLDFKPAGNGAPRGKGPRAGRRPGGGPVASRPGQEEGEEEEGATPTPSPGPTMRRPIVRPRPQPPLSPLAPDGPPPQYEQPTVPQPAQPDPEPEQPADGTGDAPEQPEPEQPTEEAPADTPAPEG